VTDAGPTPRRILVVEDDDGLKRLVQKTLRGAGYDVEGVSSGSAALEHVALNADVALLLDNKLPDMTGAELIIALLERACPVPFVVMTGHGDEKIAVKMMKLGASDYLVKGVDLIERLPGVFQRMFRELDNARSLRATEEALRESEERHRTSFERSPVCMGRAGLDGVFLDVNDNFCALLGYDRDWLVGRATLDITHPDDLDITATQIEAMDDPAARFTMEKRYVRRDGTSVWVTLNGASVVDAEGSPSHIEFVVQDITARKRAEDSLSEERSKLLRAQEIAQTGLLDWNLKTNEIELSAEALRLFAVDSERQWTTPAFVAHVVHPDDLEMVQSSLEAAVAGEGEYNIDHRVCLPGGEVVWVHAQGELVRDEEGKPATLLGTVANITERKLAMEALQENEARLSAMTEAAPAGVVSSDCEGNIVTWNASAAAMFGYSHKEALGQPVTMLMPERFRESHATGLERYTSTGKPHVLGTTVDVAALRKDGSEFPIQMTLAGWKAGGRPFFTGFFRDLTKERAAQAKLAESEALYRDLVEAAHDLVWRCDAEGRFVFLSKEWENVLGYSLDEMIGRPFTEFQTPEVIERDRLEFESHLEGASVTGYETIHMSKTGEPVTLVFNAMPIRNAAGDIVGTQGTALDVRDRIQAEQARLKLEEELRQTQKMEAIGTLAGGIAHDFNNILQIMLGYLELAREDVPADSPAARPLAEVVTAGNRAKELVGQILSFSRQSKQERRPLRIQSILEEVLRLLRSSIPTTIEMRRSIDSDCGAVIADPTEVHQVAMNLCTNAYQTMRDDGGVLDVRLEEVTVDAEAAASVPGLREGGMVRLSVRDTGSGMDAPTLGRIFDPYFTTKKVGEGTGLGLATVHAIVKRYGGAVAVESEVGVGTSFEVYFPLAPYAGDRSGDVEVDDTALPVGTESVLVVDDEPMLVKQAKVGLERLGYRVEMRTSSLEALEAFRESPDRFDVVISDQTMPHMTGVEMAKEMLVIRPEVPVILCTGFSETVDEASAKAAGIRAYVMKPVLPRALAKAVRWALDQGSPPSP
jgi:PAS domain S-box-containing protein